MFILPSKCIAIQKMGKFLISVNFVQMKRKNRYEKHTICLLSLFAKGS